MWRWPLPVTLREIEHDPLGLQVHAFHRPISVMACCVMPGSQQAGACLGGRDEAGRSCKHVTLRLRQQQLPVGTSVASSHLAVLPMWIGHACDQISGATLVSTLRCQPPSIPWSA